jgi:hypothetical protein
MCSATVFDVILNVISEFVSSQKLFTAFDVTKEVRSRVDGKVPHFDVRSFLNSEFLMGQDMDSYNRELCVLNVIHDPRAFIYYPDGKEASEYPLYKSSTVQKDPTIDDEDIIEITAEGRFNIPKSMLNQVNTVSGSYHFLIDGDNICRSPNSDGRVRFTAKEIGIDSSKCSVSRICNVINLKAV